MAIRLDLDIEGKGFTFDGNKLTTDWDEDSKVEKRENGLYLYDIAGGLDNWTIVPYSGSSGIKTNEEVVQYIYAFSRFPVDEEKRNAQSLEFLTEYEKSTNDVMNEINWLHNNGYPQRAQWFPKEHDLMIFKGVGVPLDIHELYGDLVNKTCEDGLRYPDSVCEALFVIERVQYTDSDSNKLPILDMDIRCLWSSDNCNVKPGDLLPKDRTSYTGTQPSRSPDGVIGNYYAYDFEPATFPPYNSSDSSTTSGTISSSAQSSSSGAYQSYVNIPLGYTWVQHGVQYKYNDDGSATPYSSGGHYEYTGVGSASSGSSVNSFYSLFYGNKKSVYTNAGYSFGDIFNLANESNYYRKTYYRCEVAIDYDVKTDLVTLKNGYKFPLWYLRNVKYHPPAAGDMCYVICPDHYDSDGIGCWQDGTKFYDTFDKDHIYGGQGISPTIGDMMKCVSINSSGIAQVEPWNINKGVGHTLPIDVRCLIKANHYYYGNYDTEMWNNIRSIGDTWNRSFYPSLVSIKPGASVEYVQCGSCVDPDHIWEFSSGTNPYGTQPMLVLRTFDKLNKALVTPATITKLEYTRLKPDYTIAFSGSYSKRDYAVVVSIDDLNVITLNYESYTTSTQSQTSVLPISDSTYSQYSTGSDYYNY